MESGGEERVRGWPGNRGGGQDHPPFLMPGQMVGGPEGQRSSGRIGTPPRPPIRDPYTVPYTDLQGDRGDFGQLAVTGGLGTVSRVEEMEAPNFLHTFMPIPRFETDFDLPLNLSKMSL
jgi:hypothetical protein